MWDVTDTEVKTLCTLTISTHTSRVGCDGKRCYSCQHRCISTHTSRVGCDFKAGVADAGAIYDFYWMWLDTILGVLRAINFYSHIPCGMWQKWTGDGTIIIRFLLTHPVWDVTRWRLSMLQELHISTHTSRVGCDYFACDCCPLYRDFYSHIPCGMWPHTYWNNNMQ